MSKTGRPEADAPVASDVAARLREAGFVRLVAARSGDAVAATGLLSRALARRGIPYQSSVVALPDPADRATDADLTIALGRPSTVADVTLGTDQRAASATAFDVVSELDGATESDTLLLALAGVCAAGSHPDSDLLAPAESAGIERRPGIGTPTDDVADGLAHSTLVHTPFSGSVSAAEDALADLALPEPLDDDARRRVASLAALSVAGDPEATTRAADHVEQFLRPLAGGRFGTVEGYADVLETTAKERPGLAVPLALGAVERETALAAWRDHASRAHEVVREARTGRYDGLFVARCEDGAPVDTVARLLGEFRSPEPLVLVVGDGVAVATTTDGTALQDLGGTIETVATSVDGTGAGTATRGRARFDVDPTEFVVAFREAV